MNEPTTWMLVSNATMASTETEAIAAISRRIRSSRASRRLPRALCRVHPVPESPKGPVARWFMRNWWKPRRQGLCCLSLNYES